jgi:photosystem II stability/assembly factor-like uncharacterized protein
MSKEARMTLSLSHGGGQTVYSSPTLSDEAWVGTTNGIVRIARAGGAWTVAGRMLEGKHIHALVFEPRSSTWFCGVRKDGIYASTDAGKSWAKRDSGVDQHNIYSVSAVEEGGKVVLYAGTEPAHAYRSDDLGASWRELVGLRENDMSGWRFPAPPHDAHLKHISFEPGNPRVVYGSIEQGGCYRSEDAGATWAEIPGMYADVHRVIMTPADPARLFITGGQGLWLSRDRGAHWDNIFTRGSEYGGYPDQLVYRPSDPATMIVSAGRKSPPAWREETAQARFSRTHDAGETWTVLTGGLPQYMPHSIEAMCLEEAADGATQILAATTGGSVLWTGDMGDSWRTIVEGLAPISKGHHFEGLVGARA